MAGRDTIERLSSSSGPRRHATYNPTLNSDKLFMNVTTQNQEDITHIPGDSFVFEKARATTNTKLDKEPPLSIDPSSLVLPPALPRYNFVGILVIAPSPHSFLSFVAFSWTVLLLVALRWMGAVGGYVFYTR